ncbi:MAG: PEP-CTERM sorting domain-containing protein [Rhodocyclaceae bacterium]|nr:PEP-CTERM sorting domain-containing protein [Rhodocyclaceae bacterium]
MKTAFLSRKLLAAALATAFSGAALADFSTPGLDPYAAGAGFLKPQDAAWGGWTRSAGNTLYAEWDVHSDSAEDFWSGTPGDPQGIYGDKKAGADVGSYGVAPGANLYIDYAASSNTYISGMANIFSGMGTNPSLLNVHLESAQTVLTGPVRVAYQMEVMGGVWSSIDGYGVTLGGLAPTFQAVTGSTDFTHPQMGVTMPVARYLFYWDLASAQNAYNIGFTIDGGTSLTQYSVDIAAAPVPEPETYALLLAGLGLMGSIVRRKKQA